MKRIEMLKNEAIAIVPRILGLMDRDPESSTYGCCDRNYWHYLLHDIANARLQDAGWLLALICSQGISDNRYYNNRKIYQWAIACIEFWLKIQHKNGSFNEVYPYEYSFCSTSFSAWWAGETYEELKRIEINIPAQDKLIRTEFSNKFYKGLNKVGQWLNSHDNIEVANQEAAASVALIVIWKITGDGTLLKFAEQKVQRLISCQDSSGYYPEYGGKDIGYHSLTLSCLATFRKYYPDCDGLQESLQGAVTFLNDCVGKDGLYDWHSTSRKTQYLYPFGLAACKAEGGHDVMKRYLNGLKKDRVIRPSWMDDRYCTYMAVDYLRAYHLLANGEDDVIC